MKNKNIHKSRKNLLEDLNQGYGVLKDSYKKINRRIKLGFVKTGASEWILDNTYLLEREFKFVKKNLPEDYFFDLPVDEEDTEERKLPRIYKLADLALKNEIQINEEALVKFILLKNENLTLGEVVSFPLMLRVRFLIKICEYADRVKNFYTSGKTNEEIDLFANELLEEKIAGIINKLRGIDNIDWSNFFRRVSKMERILERDPLKIYKDMEEESKDYYRHEIEKISRKYNIHQNQVTAKAFELANNNKNKGLNDEKTHIGYYIVDEGKKGLLKGLKIKEDLEKPSEETFIFKNVIGTLLLVFFTLIISYMFEWNINSIADYILGGIILIIPCSEIVVAFINYATPKKYPVNHIPKLNFKAGIGEKNKTVVVIPTMIESKEKIDSLIEKIRVIYLGNKDPNAYFCILGDFEDSKVEKTEKEDYLNEYASEKIKELNSEYSSKKIKELNQENEKIKELNNEYISEKVKEFSKEYTSEKRKELNDEYASEKIGELNNECSSEERFFYLNRRKIYNKGEGRYIGWERKRGKLMEFMQLLRGDDKTSFNYFSSNIDKLKATKYVITLDTDTFMKRNMLKKLVGAMAHPLNTPKIIKGKLNRGYSLMQPKVTISLESKNKSYFSRIFGGDSGVDGYSTAYSDTYGDRFKKGSFTGKGIIDIDGFLTLVKGKIKENYVLSHDLLEGELGRCGLLTDCEFIDEYPKTYLSSTKRLHRWVRGDFQIIRWMFSRELSTISKWKIFDNLRRSLLAPSLILGLWLTLIFLNRGRGIVIILLLAVAMPILFTVTDFVVTPKNKLNGSGKTFVQVIFIISFIPYQAYIMVDAIIKSLYRLKISKKHLLQWTASDIQDKKEKTTKGYYFSQMWFSVFSGIITIILSYLSRQWVSVLVMFIGALWIVAPYIGYRISLVDDEEQPEMEREDLEYLIKLARNTWGYYEDLVNEENNYLPPDNYQEEPFRGEAKRTSPTNIGLGLMANIVAFDFNFISLDIALDKIEKTLKSMDGLERWRGHFLNWYDTETKMPLNPKYVSTVDSGNLLSYLMIVKRFMIENKVERKEIIELLDKFINQMEFMPLYNNKKQLFHIGYNLDTGSIGTSYYDLLSSEARVASFLAIAKGEIEESHWFRLKRSYTNIGIRKTLLSWSGTMFEYLMPSLIMKKFKGSLLEATYEGAVKSQIKYANKKHVPFGISESAYYNFDLERTYQYKAFGDPNLGMKRDLEEELVISPYSTIMALQINRDKSMKNLRLLECLGAYGKYGFIEAIDYTPSRVNKFLREEIILEGMEEKKIRRDGRKIKTYMVHHLGMSLLALDNVVNKNAIIERFHSIPEVKATELLLKEKLGNNIIVEKEITVEEKLKIDSKVFEERIIKDVEALDKEVNVLSNGNYSVMLNSLGGGYSKWSEDMVYRWGGDFLSEEGGVLFYIKDEEDGEVQSPTYYPFNHLGEKYKVRFSLDKTEIHKIENKIETTLRVNVSPKKDLEIRTLKIKNLRNEVAKLQVTSYLEPILTTLEADLVHSTFSNLFIETEFLSGENVFIGKRRTRSNKQEEKYVFIALKEVDGSTAMEYESLRENFIGRNKDLTNGKGLEEKLSNSAGAALDPIMALRKTVILQKGEEKRIILLIGCTKNKGEIIETVKQYNEPEAVIKLKKQYNKGMSVLLNKLAINSHKANLYEKILRETLYLSDSRRYREDYIKKINKCQENLWSYGISGDKKIILLKTMEDKKLLKDVITLHYYLQLKGINTDLIIYNNEETSYDLPNRGAIENIISRITKERKDIFIFNKTDMDKEFLEFLIGISTIYVDEKYGDLEKQIKTFENIHSLERDIERDCKYILHINDTVEEVDKEPTEVKEEEEETLNLDFYNGYGGFSKEDGSYVINLKNKENTPRPWINVLSNRHFGTHISESGVAYTWCGNSRENKITQWSNDYIKDPMYEGIWIRDNENIDLFSIFKKPIDDGGNYKIVHGFGYSTFEHRYKDILGKITVFVPKDEKLKIQIIHLKNKGEESKDLSVFLYNALSMGVSKKDNQSLIYTGIEEDFAYAKNTYSKSFGKNIAYSTILGEGRNHYTCHIEEALSILKEPSDENLSPKCGGHYNPCLCTQKDIVILKGEEITLIAILGEEEEKGLIEEKLEKYKDISVSFKELNKIKVELDNFLGNINIKTTDKAFDYMMNGWLLYQNYNCRYLGRTAFYQSGGAYGFRDQMQDALSLGISKPELLKEQIIKNASRQYIEGDVQHWWHPIVNSGIRTRFSDDLLWLPYGVVEYINLTGDYKILSETAPYLKDEPLREGEDERYTIVNSLLAEESIYNHCIRAIEKSLKFGEHNIPLMGSGDWNDGMSTVGNGGKGESVWLGWFLSKLLNDFIPLCIHRGDKERAEELGEKRDFIIKALEEEAWDGEWYKRAYFDDGTPLGSKENEECFIDSLPQSFSVISGLGNKERAEKAMESVEKHLVDKDLGLIKLLHPPFAKSKLEPGYIKGYVPGVRENGGQYTHAATWVILALTLLNKNNKAYSYYSMINPINHSNTKEKADIYKTEPYVMSADVYIREPYAGRGGWSYYTGAAGWMYKVGLQNILGFNIIGDKGYKITPVLPEYMKGYTLNIKSEKYKIKVIKSEKKSIIINGKELEGDIIPKGLGESHIEVYI